MSSCSKNNNLFILIQAPYIENYGPMRKAAGVYFPLGIGYVGASVKKHGYDVHFIDPNVQRVTDKDIVEIIREKKPVLVGVSFMTPSFFSAKKIVDAIKQAHPEIPIVLGGAHASVVKEEGLNEIPHADFVVFGEGERTTVDLLNILSNEEPRSFEKISGLAWKSEVGAKANEERELIADLDSLPFPDRSLIDQSLYHQQSFLGYSQRCQSIYTSRGCPFRCVFCASGFKLSSTIRDRSIDDVMQEIDVMRRQNDFDYLLIKDDTFTIRRSRVIEFCKAIKTRHPDLRWHCLANVNTVDKSLLAEMREAGLHDMLYGIESGNPQILINTMKGTTIKRAREAIEACDELGIRTYGSFIFGLPGETYQTIEETIEFACSLPLTLAGFCILIPYPGTKVYDDYLQHVKKEDINYKDFLSTTGIHTVKGYDGAVDIDLSKLPEYIALAQRRFYVRPQQILRMVRGATPSIIKGYCKGLMALIHKEIYLLKLGFAKGKIKTTEGFVEESK